MKNNNQPEKAKEEPSLKTENPPVFEKPGNSFAKKRPFNSFNIRKVEYQGSRHRG